MKRAKFDAKRLVEKFESYVPAKISYLEFGGYGIDLKNITIQAKKCAVIAVDEIIEQLSDDWGDNQWRANEFIMYWNLVKNEIEYL